MLVKDHAYLSIPLTFKALYWAIRQRSEIPVNVTDQTDSSNNEEKTEKAKMKT